MQHSELPPAPPAVLALLLILVLFSMARAQQPQQNHAVSPPAGDRVFSSNIMSVNDLAAPKKARAELHQGLLHCDNRRWNDSIKHFQKALEYYSKYDSAYYDLGIAYLQGNQPEQARETFTKALEINPGNYLAELGMGILLTQEGRYAEAEIFLKKSLAPDPRNVGALAILAFSQLQRGDYEAALAMAQKVHRAEHHLFCFSHLVAAEALINLHREDEAAAEYRTFLDEEPNGPYAEEARNFLASRNSAQTFRAE